MHWSGEQDRLTEEQVALVKRQLRRETNEQLLRSYGIYLRALQLDQREPPPASTIQYFVEAWRELRRRKRAKLAQS